MVQDIRSIRLSLDEILTAYECYRRMTPEFLPHVVIVDCKTTDDGILLIARKKGGTEMQEIACKGLDVLRPLIRFCIENNIMLPRDGKKSVKFEEGHAVLHIELNLSTDLPTLVNQMRISHIKDLTLSGGSAHLAAVN